MKYSNKLIRVVLVTFMSLLVACNTTDKELEYSYLEIQNDEIISYIEWNSDMEFKDKVIRLDKNRLSNTIVKKKIFDTLDKISPISYRGVYKDFESLLSYYINQGYDIKSEKYIKNEIDVTLKKQASNDLRLVYTAKSIFILENFEKS